MVSMLPRQLGYSWLLGLLAFLVIGMGNGIEAWAQPANGDAEEHADPDVDENGDAGDDDDDDIVVEEGPIYSRKPYDLITVKVDGSQHRIQPLDLPVRRITPQTSGSLRVRLLSDPANERSIRWANIERVDLFEEMVLAEARRLTREREFDEAFRHFLFLQDQYPDVAGLERSVQDFLFVNAGYYVTQRRYAEALSTLEELFIRNREYASSSGRGVTSALSTVIGTLLQQQIASGDYSLARTSLRRYQRRYSSVRLPALDDARRRLEELAGRKRDQVRQLLDEGKWQEAEQAVREMLRIWPEVEGGIQVAREALRRYSIVPVAVTQRAQSLDVGSTTDWASRRAGRLVSRQLVELQGPGPEGGRYVSPLGEIERSDDYLQLAFQIASSQNSSSPPKMVNGYDLSERLLELADVRGPHYVEGWAEILESVRVTGATRVEANLRRPHVVPEGLLQVPLFTAEQPPPWASSLVSYQLAEQGERILRFTRQDENPTEGHAAPAEIQEVYFEDFAEALAALRRGDVLLIDRMFPADAARLDRDESNQTVLVGRYALPTLHMLIPNIENPFLNTPTFRRAILHAIPRTTILDRLLDGNSVAGCRVITGPFPAGRNPDDPIAYGYDDRLAERPFDPGVARLLFQMAQNQLRQMAEKNEQEPPEFKPLILAHPEDAIARFACTVIAGQLQSLEIPCELKQLPAGQVRPTDDQWDLLYSAVMVQEPMLDAQRLLARDGLVGSNNAYVGLALRRLRQARSWREVRDRLLELHQIVYSEVTVIPLWQLTEHYAYRNNVDGVGDRAVSLYQDVDLWRVEPVIPVD